MELFPAASHQCRNPTFLGPCGDHWVGMNFLCSFSAHIEHQSHSNTLSQEHIASASGVRDLGWSHNGLNQRHAGNIGVFFIMLPKLPSSSPDGEDMHSELKMDIVKEEYGTFQRPERLYEPMRQCRFRKGANIKAQDWMSFIKDETFLSAITIPGTHDSAAYTMSWPFVATQKLSIVQQLDAGIRYFDFRCGVRNDIVEMVHGVTYLGLTLERVLDGMYKWLEIHPSEALIIQIKKDHKEQKSNVHFANAIFQVLSKRSELWRTANTTSCIGDLRGRIQLFRRFVGHNLQAYGIDVTEWQDNPQDPFMIYTGSGVELTIQDHYAFPEPTPLPNVIARKGGDVRGLLTRADEDPDNEHWYLNFTSAFEINVVYQINARQIALGGWWFFRWKHGLNIRLRQYLKEFPVQKRRLGIVAMDFPEQGADDLISTIFLSNFGHTTASIWRSWIVLLAVAFALLSLVSLFTIILRG